MGRLRAWRVRQQWGVEQGAARLAAWLAACRAGVGPQAEEEAERAEALGVAALEEGFVS